MKVALLTDGIHPYVIGGMQKHSYYLAKYFSLNHVKVDLYHTAFQSANKEEATALDCFSEEEKQNIRAILINFPASASFPGHYLKESYHYSCKIFNEFKNNQAVDFIYCKGFAGWKLVEEKNKGYACAPIGVNFHGYEMFQKASSFRSALEQQLFKPPVRYISKKSDYVFSYGGKITEIIKRIGVNEKQIVEIPAGIERDWIKNNFSSSSKRKFLFVGRYEERKGINELSDAIQQLKGYEFEFHFVGNIPDSKKIKQPHVFYHGMIKDHSLLKKRMGDCDVLVCPSYSEGMPNVILEAMSLGLAIIATDVGAVSLLVSDKNGFLLHAPTPHAIASAMKEMIASDNPALEKKRRASIEVVQSNYVWSHVVEKLIDVVKTIIA
jgi:glycosyltransferase involved in cell wall biosynthesis